MAVVGHFFPVWLKFKAGKGVATGLGVFLAIAPWAALAALAVFIVVVWRTRYVSLGSIIAAAFLPLWILLTHTWIEPVGDFAPIMARSMRGLGRDHFQAFGEHQTVDGR